MKCKAVICVVLALAGCADDAPFAEIYLKLIEAASEAGAAFAVVGVCKLLAVQDAVVDAGPETSVAAFAMLWRGCLRGGAG